jgi:hypothetical protein
MSKEAAAAILTHLYFARVPLSTRMTQARLGPSNVDLDMIKRIGHVYAAFLSQPTLFETWAKEFGEKLKGEST